MRPLRLCAVVLLACSAFGASKAEQALQEQLAQAQAQLAALARERAAMAGQLAKLNADGKTRAQTATAQQAVAVQQRSEAAVTAEVDASAARSAAALADSKAALADSKADLANAKADALKAGTHQTFITVVGGIVITILGFMWKGYTDDRDHKWALSAQKATADGIEHIRKVSESNHAAVLAAGIDIAATQTTIKTLEQNTNHIKDALVETTAKAKYAEGLKAGTEAASPTAPGGRSVATFLTELANAHELRDDGTTARKCRDFAMVALNLENGLKG